MSVFHVINYGCDRKDARQPDYSSNLYLDKFPSIHFYYFFIYAFLSRDDGNQLIQIYSMDWREVYDTHNIEHRTEPVSH